MGGGSSDPEEEPLPETLRVGGGLRLRPLVRFLELKLGTPGTRRAEAGNGGGGMSAVSVRALGRTLDEDADDEEAF